jgi:hypothetical protein
VKHWEITADNLSKARRKTDRLADSGALGLRRLARRITSPSFRIPAAGWTYKLVEVGAASQLWTPTGEQSGLFTRRATGKRFIVRADEKLTALLELESATRAYPYLS